MSNASTLRQQCGEYQGAGWNGGTEVEESLEHWVDLYCHWANDTRDGEGENKPGLELARGALEKDIPGEDPDPLSDGVAGRRGAALVG